MEIPIMETAPLPQFDNIVVAVCWIFILWAVVGGVKKWWDDNGKWW